MEDTPLAIAGDALELLDSALAILLDLVSEDEHYGDPTPGLDHVEVRTIDSRRDAVVRRYQAALRGGA